MPTIAFSFGRCQAEKIICEIYFALRYFLRGGFRGSVRVQLKYINKKSRPAAASLLLFCLAPKGMVETKRIELSTLRMRTVRSPSWATSPWKSVPEKDKSIIAHDSIFCSPVVIWRVCQTGICHMRHRDFFTAWMKRHRWGCRMMTGEVLTSRSGQGLFPIDGKIFFPQRIFSAG